MTARLFFDKDCPLDTLVEKTILFIGYGNQGRAQALNLVRFSGPMLVLLKTFHDYLIRFDSGIQSNPSLSRQNPRLWSQTGMIHMRQRRRKMDSASFPTGNLRQPKLTYSFCLFPTRYFHLESKDILQEASPPSGPTKTLQRKHRSYLEEDGVRRRSKRLQRLLQILERRRIERRRHGGSSHDRLVRPQPIHQRRRISMLCVGGAGRNRQGVGNRSCVVQRHRSNKRRSHRELSSRGNVGRSLHRASLVAEYYGYFQRGLLDLEGIGMLR